jgi:hypothetical protein
MLVADNSRQCTVFFHQNAKKGPGLKPVPFKKFSTGQEIKTSGAKALISGVEYGPTKVVP